LPGAGIPEFMGGQPASGHSAPTTVVAPAQATWVDDIANALDSYFKAHYPTSDFTSALKKGPFFVSINSDAWLALSVA